MEPKLFKTSQIENPTEAYVLGFLYADGYIPKPDKYGKSRCVQVTLSAKDRDFLCSLRDLLGVGSIKDKIIKSKNKKYPAVVYSYYNTEFVIKLVDFGIVPRKTYSNTSNLFDSIPDNFKWDFIRGYFDGDGSIYISNKAAKISFVSLNQNLLIKISEFINKHIATLRSDGAFVSSDKKYFRLRISGADVARKFLTLLYKNAECKMERKYKIALEFLSQLKIIKKSQYLGIALKGGKWHVKVDDLSFGSYKTELEAAEVRDKIVVFINPEKCRLNFPEKRQTYLSDNLEEFYNQNIKKRKKLLTNESKSGINNHYDDQNQKKQ